MTTKRNDASGAAITAGGTVTAGAGLAAGGIPGAKSKSEHISAWKAQGKGKGGRVRRTASTARAKAPALKAAAGGVGGYRTAAHENWTKGHLQEQAHYAKETPLSELNRENAFWRGHGAGKVGPEKQIIRHMKGLRRGGTAALVGGTGVAAYGVKRHGDREKVKKNERTRKFEQTTGAMVGGGATAAGLSAGGAKVLERQAKKWKARGVATRGEAANLIPKMAGRTDSAIGNKEKKILAGQTKHVAHEAGKLRGAAGQHLYFARQYGQNARMIGRATKPSLAVAGVGAVGLGGSKTKEAWDKKRVSKSISAFGVEHAWPVG